MKRFERMLCSFLRKRGWIVFWLDSEARHCSGVCWLAQYESSEGRKPKYGRVLHWISSFEKLQRITKGHAND